MSSIPPINNYNYVNVFGYVANLAVTYGIGVGGLFGLPNNSELSEKYQTLITPVGWSFAIWSVIFLTQAAFAIAQLLAKYRSHPLVQDGVQYFFGLVCVAQILWTIAFASEVIWLSFIFMVALLVSLVLLMKSQFAASAGDAPDPFSAEYWLLQFPFVVHTGWITAATALNFNVVFVSAGAGANTQFWVAAMSLAALLGVAIGTLFHRDMPNYVIPSVVAWASAGVAAELSNPKESILSLFDSNVINSMKRSAGFVCGIVLVLTLVRAVFSVVSKRSRNRENNEGTYQRTTV